MFVISSLVLWLYKILSSSHLVALWIFARFLHAFSSPVEYSTSPALVPWHAPLSHTHRCFNVEWTHHLHRQLYYWEWPQALLTSNLQSLDTTLFVHPVSPYCLDMVIC